MEEIQALDPQFSRSVVSFSLSFARKNECPVYRSNKHFDALTEGPEGHYYHRSTRGNDNTRIYTWTPRENIYWLKDGYYPGWKVEGCLH